MYAAEVSPGNEGESGVYRNAAYKDALVTKPHPDVNTIHELLQFAARRAPDAKAFGTRPLKKIHVVEKEVKNLQGVYEKKQWSYLELGAFEWHSYKEILSFAEHIGFAFTTEEFGALKSKDKFGIYAETSEQWITVANACITQNITIATVYANLGEEGVIYSLNDTQLSHILTDVGLLGSLLKAVEKLPKLKYVFYTDHREAVDTKIVDTLKQKGLKVFSYTELFNAAAKLTAKTNPPEPDDLALIMYTSGTTGVPKGVMITHRNCMSAVACCLEMVGKDLNIGPGDNYCSFLPLAHILELNSQYFILFAGGALAFGSPRTMMDDMVENCKGDLNEAQPTLMVGVPLLWERIRKGSNEKLRKAPALLQRVFDMAYSAKYLALSYGFPSLPVVDQVIFNKFKAVVGGKIRGLASGGAPLSHSTHQFLRIVFNIPAFQGYGLTETTGSVCTQPLDHLGTGVAGAISGNVEVKLVDVPEMGYTHNDKPHARGELWVRGDSVTLGYYNQPEKTKESYKEGGWFATGDIVQMNADGTISIVDRKKNLVKLPHGEYIALESIESKLKQNLFVDEICIVADSQINLPVAVVLPNRNHLIRFATENGIDTSDFEKLVRDEKVKEAVKKSLHATAAKEKMKVYEKPSGVFITSDEWTPQSGLITAASKIKRQDIQRRYQEDIDKLLKGCE